MDMTDITQAAASRRIAALDEPHEDADDGYDLLTQIGSEVAGPLTAALERVTTLGATGRIDHTGLRALREEIEGARGAAMIGQQMARFATGRVHQTPEAVSLTDLLRDVLLQRTREVQARGLEFRPSFKPISVLADPSLLFALANTLVDWLLAHSRGPVALKLDLKTWPAHALLSCRFMHRPPDEVEDPRAPTDLLALDTMPWRLFERMARAMGLLLTRSGTASECRIELEFPRTVRTDMGGMSAIEIDDGLLASPHNSRPQAGSHVLVLASRRELRTQVRDAVRHMGLMLDFVGSIDEAREFCTGGLPHAVVYESALGGARFEQWHQELLGEMMDLVFVAIEEDGNAFEVSGFRSPVARVGRNSLATALPSVLAFELSRKV